MKIDPYINNLKQTSKSLLQFFEKEPTPIWKFFAGIVLIPAQSALKSVIQQILNPPPIAPLYGLEIRSESSIRQIASNSLFLLEEPPVSIIAKPFFYGEFVQNYLLNQKLSILLNRFTPHYAHLPKTTMGKIARVIITSLLDASMIYLRQQMRQQSLGKICSDYYAPYSCQVDSSLALAVDAFAGTCIAGAARELTNSNLPGVGMYFHQFR